MINVLWLRASLLSRLVVYLFLALAAIFTLIPFLWAIVNSVKTSADTFQAGAIIPFVNFNPTLDSWREVLSDPQAINAFVSSVVVSLGTTIFALALGVPAAYALARFRFPIGGNDITLWFLSQRVLPPAVVLVPFYLLLVDLNLIDTWTGLILCYSTFNLAFAVVIMRDIFRDVSTEIEDAAKVEGARPWQVFWKVSLPLSVDGLVVTSVLIFALLERGAVRLGAHITKRDDFFCAGPCLALNSGGRFQRRLSQHHDRHRAPRHSLFLCPALSRPRPVLRRRKGLKRRPAAIHRVSARHRRITRQGPFNQARAREARIPPRALHGGDELVCWEMCRAPSGGTLFNGGKSALPESATLRYGIAE